MVLASSWTLIQAAGCYRRLKTDEGDRGRMGMKRRESTRTPSHRDQGQMLPQVKRAARLAGWGLGDSTQSILWVQRDSGISDARVAG